MTSYLPAQEGQDDGYLNILVEMALQKVEEANVRYLDNYAIADIVQDVWKEQILPNITAEQLSTILAENEIPLLADSILLNIAQEIRKRLNAWNN